MSTGILRPLDHLAPDAAHRLVGARYGVILLPMRPAPVLDATLEARLAVELLQLGISPEGLAGAELLDMAFREGLIPEWRCPYGRGGDQLWVRDLWAVVGGEYRLCSLYTPPEGVCVDWRPAHSMPRAAARLVLQIDDVGVAADERGALVWRVEVEVVRP